MCQNLMPTSEPLKLERRLLVPIHSSFTATSVMEEDVAATLRKRHCWLPPLHSPPFLTC